ncbi:MAG: sugar-binding protein [Pseudomonadota bacterium]
MIRRFALTLALLTAACVQADEPRYVAVAPTIDGLPTDAAWAQSQWRQIDDVIIGSDLAPDDFDGRYKLLWNESGLFLLAEIRDDILIDTHADPLAHYWDDDALEIFIDADASGGEHLYDYNAYAYHVALDNQAVDIGPFRSKQDRENGRRYVRTFPEHIESRWQRSLDDPHLIYWEVAITVHGEDADAPVQLDHGHTLGFMLSYCDADDATGRQHFIGDVDIAAVDGDRNRGYIDASVFRKITLQK